MKIEIKGLFANVSFSQNDCDWENDICDILTFQLKRPEDEPVVLYDKLESRFLSGLAEYVCVNLKRRGIEFSYVDDINEKKLSIKNLKGIEYRDYQKEAIQAVLERKRGVIKISTAGGKTVIAAGILKTIGKNSLFLVTQIPLLHQAVKKFKEFGINDVGIVGDGHSEFATHTIAYAPYLSQLINKSRKGKNNVQDFLYGVKVVIIDEAHHSAAKSWMNCILNCSNSDYRIGMSGTPYEIRNGYELGNLTIRDAQLIGMTGPILYEIKASTLVEAGYISRPKIYIFDIDKPKVNRKPTEKGAPPWAFQRNYNKIYEEGIVNHTTRNEIAIEVILTLSKIKKLRTLVLVSRIEHGKMLLNKLRGFVSAIFVAGQRKVYRQDEFGVCESEDTITNFESESIREFIEGKHQVLLASPVLGEGYDLPGSSVEAMVMLPGGKGLIPVLQRLGRALRPKSDGGEVTIVDFMDRQHVYLNSHSNNRIREYEAEGYEILSSEDFVSDLLGEK